MSNSFLRARNKSGRIKRQKKPWKPTSAMSERRPVAITDFNFVRPEDLRPPTLEDFEKLKI